MTRSISFTLIIAAILCGKIQGAHGEQLYSVAGNGFQPLVFIKNSGENWYVNIDVVSQTNFPQNTWLKTTNRVGAKLQLWMEDGRELYPTNQDVLKALQLPAQTTVTAIMNGVHYRRRGMQWIRSRAEGLKPGDFRDSGLFNLQSSFDVSSANNVVLQITPLLYKVGADKETAHLVELPPLKVKLLSDGRVERISPAPTEIQEIGSPTATNNVGQTEQSSAVEQTPEPKISQQSPATESHQKEPARQTSPHRVSSALQNSQETTPPIAETTPSVSSSTNRWPLAIVLILGGGLVFFLLSRREKK